MIPNDASRVQGATGRFQHLVFQPRSCYRADTGTLRSPRVHRQRRPQARIHFVRPGVCPNIEAPHHHSSRQTSCGWRRTIAARRPVADYDERRRYIAWNQQCPPSLTTASPSVAQSGTGSIKGASTGPCTWTPPKKVRRPALTVVSSVAWWVGLITASGPTTTTSLSRSKQPITASTTVATPPVSNR